MIHGKDEFFPTRHCGREIAKCFYLRTGQETCHNTTGNEIDCRASGQDAEFGRGIPWPKPRFSRQEETVLDHLTGLIWTENANIAEFPLRWQEALDYVSRMNKQEAFGHDDWRLPNRRELRSLMSHQTRRPALPLGHPFTNVFLGWYWTSTTAAISTAYAWYIHMEGARMFYGNKEQFSLLWPVRGEGYGILPITGQNDCYRSQGQIVPCQGSGQDGELRFGRAWPDPRFDVADNVVIDRLTGLGWSRKAGLTETPVTWDAAFEAVAHLNQSTGGTALWRLPNINELESLVDCSRHSPALPERHPFESVRESYWSSTTSMFEPDWAWALYLAKGAVGVGHKSGPHFSVWPVCNPAEVIQ